MYAPERPPIGSAIRNAHSIPGVTGGISQPNSRLPDAPPKRAPFNARGRRIYDGLLAGAKKNRPAKPTQRPVSECDISHQQYVIPKRSDQRHSALRNGSVFARTATHLPTRHYALCRTREAAAIRISTRAPQRHPCAAGPEYRRAAPLLPAET